MSWKNTIRKTERDMSVGSTNYAKDLGESVMFGEGSQSITVPKAQLNELIERYNPEIQRLTQITMSSGPTDRFIMWLKQNM